MKGRDKTPRLGRGGADMNIEVQCCGIAVLLLIWYFSLRKKPLGLESKRLFLIMMGVTSGFG